MKQGLSHICSYTMKLKTFLKSHLESYNSTYIVYINYFGQFWSKFAQIIDARKYDDVGPTCKFDYAHYPALPVYAWK